MTFASTVLPVSMSAVCGWWQSEQSFTSWREPPCMPSCPTDPAFFTESWQFEHVDVSRILSHTSVTFCPSGRKSYSTFAKYDFCTFVGMPTTLVRLRLA